MENGKNLIHSWNVNEFGDGNYRGLTKREYFAGLAMQGLLSLYDNGINSIVPNVPNVEYMAKLAVTASDELLKQLES